MAGDGGGGQGPGGQGGCGIGVEHCPEVLFVGQKVTPGWPAQGRGAQPPPGGAGGIGVEKMSPTHQRELDGWPPAFRLASTTLRFPMWKISGHSKCAPLMDLPGCACQTAVPASKWPGIVAVGSNGLRQTAVR